MQKLVWLIVILIGFGGGISTVARADETTDLIKEAMEAYQDGAYMETKSILKDALQMVNVKVSEKLEAFLPEPLDGWEAMKAQSQQMPAILGAGAVGISRQYRNSEKRINIEILAAGGGMFQMFMSPDMHIADGGKPIRIKRNKGSIKIQDNMDSEMIIAVADNKYMVKMTGSGATEDEVMQYANAIDYKGLKNF